MPELISPAIIKEDPHALSLIPRVLRIYPQFLSLYVGFDNGEFFMVTHIAGADSAALRDALHAPPDAVFANEIISADTAGDRKTRWVFLGEDGTGVGRASIRLPLSSIPNRVPGTVAPNAATRSSRVVFTFSRPAVSRASR